MLSHLIPNSSRSYDSGSPPSQERPKNQSTPVMIAVMGATRSGKSSFINRASGSSLRVGTGLKSCTYEVNPVDPFLLDGIPVILIDTPGFDETSKSDVEVLKLIAAYLASTYEKGFTLAGVIYIHRISDRGLTGIAGRNFKIFRDLCGDTTLRNVALVTNMWGNVFPQDGQARESELSGKFSKPVLDEGARMFRHNDTVQSTHDIIRKIMTNHPEALQIQRELVDERKDIINTTAGAAVIRELSEQIRRHKAELEELREAMGQALRENDEETRQELAEQAKQLQDLTEKTEKDKREMSSRYAKEKERAEAAIAKMEEVEEERDRAEADRVGVEREATAGAAVNRELSEQVKRHQAELEELREEMGQALGENDEMRKELEELREEMRQVLGENDEMRQELEELREEMGQASGEDDEEMEQELEEFEEEVEQEWEEFKEKAGQALRETGEQMEREFVEWGAQQLSSLFD